METSEPFPTDAVDPTDLAELVAEPGPFLSMYLNTEPDVEKAAQRSEVRWKSVRSNLAHRGVPRKILDEIDPIVPDAHLSGACLAVIADERGVLHVEHGPPVSPQDIARWEPLPGLLPIVRWRQSEPTFVVVLIDRTGAELFAVRRGSTELHADVEGEHDVIRKVRPGGWSQRRYQQRAEDSWEHNADQVAGALTRFVERVRPVFVAVAGDVRAVSLLRGALSKEVDVLVHVIEREVRWDGSGDPIPEEARELADAHVREAEERLLSRFSEERGQRDEAVEGLERTAQALQQGQVATLLVADGQDDRTLWFGPDPALLAATDLALKDLGVDSPAEAPAKDVLVRGALGTGARIRVLDRADAVADGVGALLRWGAETGSR
jgi:Bacterial archaeo-eukaryotic release factor family 2